jgi:hypothetical protein
MWRWFWFRNLESMQGIVLLREVHSILTMNCGDSYKPTQTLRAYEQRAKDKQGQGLAHWVPVLRCGMNG